MNRESEQMTQIEVTDIREMYERPAVEIDEDLIVTVRASQATACRRQLYYAGTETPQSDEVPPDALVRMAMGNYLEPLILDMLEKSHGWRMHEDPLAWKFVHEVALADDLVMSGIPDGVGFHDHNGGKPCAIEIKTRNAQQFRNTVMQGAYRSHFGAVVQLAMYREALIEAEEIDRQVDNVLVSMNKDTGDLHFEWFPYTVLEQAFDEITMRMNSVIETWGAEPPDKEFEASSWQCKSCQWRTVCGNVEQPFSAEIDIEFGEGKITAEEARDALVQWEEQKLVADEHKMNDKLDKWARGVLLRYAQGLGAERVRLGGEAGDYNISVQQNESIKLNEQLVRYYLTPKQWDEVLDIKSGDPYVVIRKARGRQ